MSVKKFAKFSLIFFILISIFLILYNFFNKKQESDETNSSSNEILYSANIMEDVSYSSKDEKGNQYLISAKLGEIDYSNSNIIYLTKVSAAIKLKNSDKIKINSEYGKYNSENFDTIFSKNVKIEYLDNTIKSEYLDFSLERNLMIISRQVIYSNLENILKADVIEMEIDSKNTKIYMYDINNKVKIKNK